MPTMDEYAAHFADETAKLREQLEYMRELCKTHGFDSVTSALAEVVRLRRELEQVRTTIRPQT